MVVVGEETTDKEEDTHNMTGIVVVEETLCEETEKKKMKDTAVMAIEDVVEIVIFTQEIYDIIR